MRTLLQLSKELRSENPKYNQVFKNKKFLKLNDIKKWKINRTYTLYTFDFSKNKLVSFKFKYLGYVYNPKNKIYEVHGKNKFISNNPLSSHTKKSNSGLVTAVISSDLSPIIIKK